MMNSDFTAGSCASRIVVLNPRIFHRLRIVLAISFLSILVVVNLPNAYAASNIGDNSVKMTKQGSFIDSHGNLNVVGAVDNNGDAPIEVTVGLNTTTNNGSSHNIKTIIEPTYGTIIYPSTGGAPFKFVIPHNTLAVGQAFIAAVKKIQVPYYDVVVLNYNNTATGTDRALVGTAKNTGSFDIHDLIIYASAHDSNGAWIDSVKSNIIPIIKPGEHIAFSAKPDTSVKSKVSYFSCAGLAFLDPINTLKVNDTQYIAYDMEGLAKISDLRYDNSTNSIMFGITHYNPAGGSMTLKLPQYSKSQAIFIMMDGKLYKQATAHMNGKTILIDFFVPPGDHQMQIRGAGNTS
jgi:hypothetical protein